MSYTEKELAAFQSLLERRRHWNYRRRAMAFYVMAASLLGLALIAISTGLTEAAPPLAMAGIFAALLGSAVSQLGKAVALQKQA